MTEQQAALLIIERQLVAIKCSVETALDMMQAAMAMQATETPAEAKLPDASGATLIEEPPAHRVFGGGAPGVPRQPAAPQPTLVAGADGVLSSAG